MMYYFKYGFEHKGFQYGWFEKELYRLPSKSDLRYFGFKKLTPITVGNQIGYRCKRDKLSVYQLQQLTGRISVSIEVIKDKDVPF